MKWNIKGISMVLLAAMPIVVGAALAGGLLLNAPIVGLLPDIVHTVLGWGLMIAGAVGFFNVVK